MRTMAEMARGRGAVNEAIFYSQVAEGTEKVRRATRFPVFVTPVIYDDNPDTWQVQCCVRRITQSHNGLLQYETVIEVIEPRNVFPSDFLMAQVLLVS